MITDARKVLHAAASYKYDRMFLKIVADAGDIGRDLYSVGQSHAGYFSKRGVRFFWRLSINAGADPSFLRTRLKRWARSLIFDLLAALSNQLIQRRHVISSNWPGVLSSGSRLLA